MTDYAAYFKSTDAGNTFFAGANTPHGFVSDYGSLLSEDTFSKVYIIKGGSGTGKSTLMRRCAAASAAVSGSECTLLLCGSDPDSLDGVIIEKGEIRIAVIDGTAPHTVDPVYAGACGEIINCGDYWDASLLEKAKPEIARRSAEKKLLYLKTYRYLRAAAEMMTLQQKSAGEYLLRQKMARAVSRLTEKAENAAPRRIARRTACISMKGAMRLNSLEKRASKVIAVRDFGFLSPMFFTMLEGELMRRGHDIIVSEYPVFGVCEVLVPDADTVFVSEYAGREYEKTVNLRRFADMEIYSSVRQKQRFAGKCLTAMLDGALSCLAEIGDAHFALEEIYGRAMDFTALDELSVRLCEKVVQRLKG